MLFLRQGFRKYAYYRHRPTYIHTPPRVVYNCLPMKIRDKALVLVQTRYAHADHVLFHALNKVSGVGNV